tara:strand:+ start:3105 stop:3992 length:888 start_codon:yes stop_codon:yes gene_type:complete
LEDNLPASDDGPVNDDSTPVDESTSVETPIEPVKKYRVKGDGFDEEVDEATLIKGYQIERSANKRMEDASKLSKDARPVLAFIDQLRKGDLSQLKKLGIPADALRKFNEDELLDYIKDQERSPEEKRAIAAERERDSLKADKETSDKKQMSAYKAHLEEKAATQIQSEFEGAFKELDIPMKGNHSLVSMASQEVVKYQDADKSITVLQAMKNVIKGLENNFSEYASREYKRNPEEFLKRLPSNFLDGVRKRDLKNVESQIPIGGTRDKDFKQEPRSSKNSDDFRSYMKDEFQKRG